MASRDQRLACRTDVPILRLIVDEVLAQECAVFARRFVDDRNMRGNPLGVDKPIEVRCRPISSVGREPFWFDAKTHFGPLDHCLRGADLGLTNGPRGLDIHDDPALHIDKILSA